MITAEGLKNYSYGDDASFQPEIAVNCLNAAKEYYLMAGVAERDSALYEQAVYLLACHWYDNRALDLIGQVRGEVSYGVQAMIHQLANTPPSSSRGDREVLP